MFATDKNFIGRKIKYFRKKRNITQSKLAELVDLSEKHISKIESGTHQPSISAFFNIIQALNIGLEEFGLSLKTTPNPVRDEIYKHINDSTDYELNIILPLIKCLKENLKTK